MRKVKSFIILFLMLTVLTLLGGMKSVKAVEGEDCINDVTAPTISNYHDFLLEVGQIPPDYLEGIVFYDSCGTVEYYVEERFIDLSQEGTYPLYYFASDRSGNSTTVRVFVTVKWDITAPVFSGVVNRSFKANTVLSDELFLDGVSATDNRDGDISSLINVDYSQVNVSVVGEYDVIYTITDAKGNTTTETIKVTIYDDEAPQIILIEPTVRFEVFSLEPNWFDLIQVIDNVDAFPSVTIIENTVDFNQLGTYSVTYKAVDAEGNESTNTLVVIIEDTTAPTVIVEDQTFEVFSSITDWLSYITVTDNYDQNVIIDIDYSQVNLNQLGTYLVTVTATDASGNETVETFTVTIEDSTAPVIEVTNPTVEVHSPLPNWMNDITVTDNYDEQVVIDIDDSLVNLDLLGSYTITVTATDASGNVTVKTMTVTVIDSTPPVIEVNHPTIEVHSTLPDWFSYIVVTDNYDEIPVVEIIENNVDLHVVGTYSITFRTVDAEGNEATATLIVTVVDTTPPTIVVEDQTYEVFSEKPNWLDLITVSDNYDSEVVINVDDSLVNFNLLGTFIVTVTATDEFGNSSEVTFTVTIVDTTNPVIEIENQTVEVFSPMPNWLNLITVSDNYDLAPAIIIDDSLVNLNQLGSYTVTVTAIDQSLNTYTIQFVVNVVDQTKPVVTGPEVTPIIEVFSDEPDWLTFITFEDNYDEHPTASVTQTVNLNVLGDYDVTVEVTDASGNSTTITYVVRVVDTVKPEFIFNELFIHKIGDVAPNYLENLVVIDNYDEVIPNEKVKIHDLYVDLTREGLYPVTFEVMDSSGNYNYITTNIWVYDDEAPVFYGTTNYTIPNTFTTIDYLSGVTATDNLLGDVTNRIIVDDSHVNYALPGVYRVNYIVTDLSNNVTIETVYVTIVEDLISPTIHNTQDFTIEVYSVTPNYLLGVTATDNLDSEVIVTVNSDAVNLNSVGTYDIVYTASDRAGNSSTVVKKVNVVDTLAPVIHGTKDLTVEVHSAAPNYLEGVTATDNYDTNLTVTVDSSAVVLTVTGTYKITYTVTDSSNHTTTKDVTVTVVDTEMPVINGTKDYTVEVNGSAPDYLDGVTATDNYDTNLSVTVDSSAVVLTVTGTYTITYSVTDSSNHTSTKEVTVTVVDTEKPVINGTKDLTVEINSSAPNYLDGVSATDNYDTNLTVTVNSSAEKLNVLGTYKVIYSVTDSSNQTTTKEVTVTVRDTVKPVISGANNVTIKKGDEFSPKAGITATDNSNGQVTISNSGSYDANKAGEYTITITATDESGNNSQVTITLTVEDVKDEETKKESNNVLIYSTITILASVSIVALLATILKKRK